MQKISQSIIIIFFSSWKLSFILSSQTQAHSFLTILPGSPARKPPRHHWADRYYRNLSPRSGLHTRFLSSHRNGREWWFCLLYSCTGKAGELSCLVWFWGLGNSGLPWYGTPRTRQGLSDRAVRNQFRLQPATARSWSLYESVQKSDCVNPTPVG